MEEVIKHSLGLCGESHATFIGFLLEFPTLSHIFNYITNKTKQLWQQQQKQQEQNRKRHLNL
jgi:hypothetical protein